MNVPLLLVSTVQPVLTEPMPMNVSVLQALSVTGAKKVRSLFVEGLLKILIAFHIEIDECLTANCQNGATCVDLVADFRCDCSPGFEGRLCASGEQSGRNACRTLLTLVINLRNR